METKKLICICCPLGCPIVVEMKGEEVITVTGNTCPRGAEYAKKEVTNPTRVLTTTIALTDGGYLPVKTAQDIPKDKLFECLATIKKMKISRPVCMNQVLCSNICGTGVDVVACDAKE